MSTQDPSARNSGTIRIRVASESDATRSVVEATCFCKEASLSEMDSQCVATAVSELSRNILKYAGEGEIFFQRRVEGNCSGVLVTARDRGPGIDNIDAAMTDHFSSSGTLGLGLPGVKRMMDEFAIQSEPGKGTQVSILKWSDTGTRPRGKTLTGGHAGSATKGTSQPYGKTPLVDYECAVYVRACPGERVSGDLALVERRDHLTLLALVDALGHGPEAHKVAERARRVLQGKWSADAGACIRTLHEGLRGSLGAVAGIAIVDHATKSLRYVGVGNTALRIFGSSDSRLPSTAGTLGGQIRSPSEHRRVIAAGDVVVMYTDGIKDRFELADYPQMRYQSANTVARAIVDRFGKNHDDAGCIVLRSPQ